MKQLFILFFSVFFGFEIQAQSIEGKVTNNQDGSPIEYVNIGIVDVALGTITDKDGNFKLDVKGLPLESKVAISMVGFKAQTFTIEKLLKSSNLIKLQEISYHIEEVIIKPNGSIRKIGTTNFTRGGGVCGWGGTQFSSGHELGLQMDLGNTPVELKSLHIRLYKQSFDSTLLRLHIRDVKGNLPNNELLKENILVNITKESGWVEIDISNYNIVLSGEVILTLEWLKIFGINNDRLIKMNKSKNPTANVLFNLKKNNGTFYIRRGSEAKWTIVESQSPSFYITVIE